MAMRDPAHCRRFSWPDADLPAAGPVNRLAAERPGPDGIRWGLVSRVRAEIAAGVYDSPDRFAAAEEELFRRLEGRA
jgi:hypothetical protein